MSRGAKYFAVDTAPTEERPPSPVLMASIVSVKSRTARSTAARGFERRLARFRQAHSGRSPVEESEIDGVLERLSPAR